MKHFHDIVAGIAAAQRSLEAMPPLPDISRVVSSPLAVRAGGRQFPASKNRSARIHKKLVKRFGGEFQQVPCIYRANGVIIAHPSLYPEVMAALHTGLGGRP